MFKPCSKTILWVSVAAGMAFMSGSAWAGFQASGYDLQVVDSAVGLENAAVSYQTIPTWSASGLNTPVSRNFTLPACQNIHFARLYLDVWGGSNYKNARATVTVNGTALPVIDFGNTGTVSAISTYDANPTFNAGANCVYGSGAGAWQIGFSGIADLLHTDGTANTINVTISDPQGSQFDGRMYGISLVSVYQDPSIDQTLDYYLAEADGTMRSGQPNSYGSPNQRSLTLSGLNTTNVNSAVYHAGYTHGNTASGTSNLDQLYFNGTALGVGNDVSTGDAINYPPNNLAFDVSGYLAANPTVRYSVNSAELGGTGDTYLRANIGLLEIAHPIPEPATLGLLVLGGLVAGRKRKARI